MECVLWMALVGSWAAKDHPDNCTGAYHEDNDPVVGVYYEECTGEFTHDGKVCVGEYQYRLYEDGSYDLTVDCYGTDTGTVHFHMVDHSEPVFTFHSP